MIKLVLADDHNLVRAGLRALLEALPDVKVVADVSDGEGALAAIRRLRPDIALLDIAMPGLSGLEVASRVLGDEPATRVVLLSMHANEAYVAEALRIGVSGYVLKDAFFDELPLLLRAVMRGEPYLSPGISRQVVDALRNGVAGLGPESAGPLTPRQREILRLVAAGHNTKEIAFQLGVSAKTVETHRAQLMERLDIRSIPGLVKYAIRNGLATSDG